MGQIRKSLRFEILTRDGYRCRYCGASSETAVLHIDHILPRADGGLNDSENLVTACADCNLGKSDRKILGIPPGFSLTPDKRPARLVKLSKAIEQQGHVLDCSRIAEFDEIDDGTQLCWVWCQTHSRNEWHSLPLDFVEMQDGLFRTSKKPVTW